MLDYSKQEQWTNGFGGQQSPIALRTSDTVNTSKTDLLFKWPTKLIGDSISDMQTNFQVNGTGEVQIEGRQFIFQQLHFHAPAEHVVDGQPAAMEWHFVFQDSVGQLVVVARLAQVGNSNPLFEQLLASFEPGTTTLFGRPVELQDDLPQTGTVYRYLGSLTTPPLTEGVRWFVNQMPLNISATQLARYQALFPQPNNRQLQGLNQRSVLLTDITH